MNRTEVRAKVIRDNIKLISKFIETDYYKKLKKDDYDKYTKELIGIFPSFAETYESIFTKLISGDDMEMVNLIIDSHIELSHGKITVEECEKRAGMGIMNGIEDKYVNK